MKNFLRFAPLMAITGLILLAACGGSATTEPPARPTPTSGPTFSNGGQPVSLTLENHGGSMEGHTPRGFQGSGAGLFAGDNLNRNFPNGDGVQIFLTFDLSGIPQGKVESAVLSAVNATVIRTRRHWGDALGLECEGGKWTPPSAGQLQRRGADVGDSVGIALLEDISHLDPDGVAELERSGQALQYGFEIVRL